MGWRGTLRTINSVARAAEREAQRQHKKNLKLQISEDAADAVFEWEQHIKKVMTIHTKLDDSINWQEVLIADPPKKLQPSVLHRNPIIPKVKVFKPSIFDFLFGGTEKRKAKLISAYKIAKDKDAEEDRNSNDKFEIELAEWKNDVDMASRLIAGDISALREVIDEMMDVFAEDLIGSKIRFSFDEKLIHAEADVHTDEIIPSFRRKQLASGKLSETKMPIGQFNEIYQDYVASVALKIAGDLFHITPLDEVYVTCKSKMLNSQTGHQEMSPILCVKFVRDTFRGLDLEYIDPSDSLKNFIHKMDFKKNRGFLPIDTLT